MVSYARGAQRLAAAGADRPPFVRAHATTSPRSTRRRCGTAAAAAPPLFAEAAARRPADAHRHDRQRRLGHHAADPARASASSSALTCQALPPPAMDQTNKAADLSGVLSTRERTERVTEMEGTTCVGCHKAMLNPWGFVFEGFDALGRVRSSEVVRNDSGAAAGREGRSTPAVDGQARRHGRAPARPAPPKRSSTCWTAAPSSAASRATTCATPSAAPTATTTPSCVEALRSAGRQRRQPAQPVRRRSCSAPSSSPSRGRNEAVLRPRVAPPVPARRRRRRAGAAAAALAAAARGGSAGHGATPRPSATSCT